jgi:sterol desaturase/sphingolipid hydroxylase (fatty acid hydroxylase superfamily)
VTLPEFGLLVAAHAWTLLVLLFLAAAAWEVLRPRRGREGGASLALHWATSLSLFAGGVALLGLVPLGPLEPWLGFAARGPFALAEDLGGHALVLLAGILALDLYGYLSHRAQHALGPLWRLHAVHHADEEPNALTALRHHPLVFALDALVALALLAGLLGMPLWVFPIYALLWRAVNLFAHANIALPERAERWLGLVLVTPRMHRVHHSAEPADFDANFGAALSVWDRLFGTLRERETDVEAFGVPGFRGAAQGAKLGAGWRGFALPWALPFLRGHRPASGGATPGSPPAAAPR